MPKIVAQIPDDIYRDIDEEIKLGVFSDASEAVVSALKKAYARKSRSCLRWLMKKEGLTEASMLKEPEKMRRWDIGSSSIRTFCFPGSFSKETSPGLSSLPS